MQAVLCHSQQLSPSCSVIENEPHPSSGGGTSATNEHLLCFKLWDLLPIFPRMVKGEVKHSHICHKFFQLSASQQSKAATWCVRTQHINSKFPELCSQTRNSPDTCFLDSPVVYRFSGKHFSLSLCLSPVEALPQERSTAAVPHFCSAFPRPGNQISMGNSFMELIQLKRSAYDPQMPVPAQTIYRCSPYCIPTTALTLTETHVWIQTPISKHSLPKSLLFLASILRAVLLYHVFVFKAMWPCCREPEASKAFQNCTAPTQLLVKFLLLTHP